MLRISTAEFHAPILEGNLLADRNSPSRVLSALRFRYHPWFSYKAHNVWLRCCTHATVAVFRFGSNSIYGPSEWNLSGCMGSVFRMLEQFHLLRCAKAP